MPEGVTEQKFDFETKGIEGWTQAGGQWVVEDFAGAPVGKKALLQRATKNEFNVIVAPAGPFTDVDVSVKFDPLSGKEDASGGIVLRYLNSHVRSPSVSILANPSERRAGGLRRRPSRRGS